MNPVQLIFSLPLLLINRVRRIKLDGFVGGLIFGSIFSLVVNIITIQMQDKIARQKTYEAIENEIDQNLFDAQQIKTNYDYDKEYEKKEKIKLHIDQNAYNHKFSFFVWDRALVSGYIYYLDPYIQTALSAYYNIDVKYANDSLADASSLFKKLSDEKDLCEAKVEFYRYQLRDLGDYDKASSGTKQFMKELSDKIGKGEEPCNGLELYLRSELDNHYTSVLSASYFIKDGTDRIRKVFHPTQDRLKDPLLRLIMGTNVKKSLSDKK